MSRTYVITGGSGFIGTYLIEKLLKEDKDCIIHNLDIKDPTIKDIRIHFHKCDIRNPIKLKIDNKPDTVLYHLAAIAKEPGFPWDDYFKTNHVGTINIINFAQENYINTIIYTSTMMVYKAGEVRMTEESLTAPDTGYGISKLLGEMSLLSWADSDKSRKLRMVRIGVVFGKGENGNFTRLYYALRKRGFAYIGKNKTIKSSIYVKDVVSFLLFLETDNNHTIYNLAYPEAYSIKYICNTFFRVFNFKRFIPVIPFGLALFVSYIFEILNNIGIIRTSIHHRRIEKLYYSTNIASDKMLQSGFELKYSLEEALTDWKNDCLPDDLY